MTLRFGKVVFQPIAILFLVIKKEDEQPPLPPLIFSETVTLFPWQQLRTYSWNNHYSHLSILLSVNLHFSSSSRMDLRYLPMGGKLAHSAH